MRGQSIIKKEEGPCSEEWEEILYNYYRLMGWDRKNGKPLPETPRELRLEHLIETT